jgi:hypothetical protein
MGAKSDCDPVKFSVILTELVTEGCDFAKRYILWPFPFLIMAKGYYRHPFIVSYARES